MFYTLLAKTYPLVLGEASLTELAPLAFQSNMIYLYRERARTTVSLNWVVQHKLFRLLKLPVFDAVHRALEEFQ